MDIKLEKVDDSCCHVYWQRQEIQRLRMNCFVLTCLSASMAIFAGACLLAWAMAV